jgi:hypothetical protein
VVLTAGPVGAQEILPPSPPPSSPSPTPSPTVASTPTAQSPVRGTLEVRPDRHRRQRPEGGGQHRRRHERRRKHRRVTIKAGCGPFAFTQTYIGWGPALAYGEPVTVAYEGSRCTTPEGTGVGLSVQGTATVYRGILAERQPIDTRPFTVTGTWNHPTNAAGWPPDWWQCDVKHATYTWEIAGMYTFEVEARWGVWTLQISTQGLQPKLVHWAYNGCG